MNTKKDNSFKSIEPKRDSSIESLLNSEHIITIEKMSIGGDGVARIPFLDRTIVVFIPLSAPQDQLQVKIIRTEKTFLFGSILKIIKPGPNRRIAPCPVANACGGCSWQHIDESEQVNQKELLLKELFKKFLPNIDYNLSETQISEKKFEYRNRIQLKHLNNELGYFKPNTHTIVPIEDCLLAEPELRHKIKELKLTLKPALELKKYELRINNLNQVEYYEIGSHGEGLAFSQVNNSVNDLLVNKTINIICSLLKDNPQALLTELYAGAGNFTFALNQLLPKVRIEAIELNNQLTAAASEIIKTKKLIKNVTFFTTKAEIFCNNQSLSKDLILLDPPRTGCHTDTILRIAEANPKNIVYISCHPTMLVRDLSILLKKSTDYKVKHLQIFDMFPQTDHFETLCILERN